MKVLFVQSDKPNVRQRAMTEVRKEIFRQHGFEVVTKTVDSCRNDGLKYDTVWYDELMNYEGVLNEFHRKVRINKVLPPRDETDH